VDGYLDSLLVSQVDTFKEGLLNYFKDFMMEHVMPVDTEDQKKYNLIVTDFQNCLKEFLKS
jgi:hypothetical protein